MAAAAIINNAIVTTIETAAIIAVITSTISATNLHVGMSTRDTIAIATIGDGIAPAAVDGMAESHRRPGSISGAAAAAMITGIGAMIGAVAAAANRIAEAVVEVVGIEETTMVADSWLDND
jgi:hypothetical protein